MKQNLNQTQLSAVTYGEGPLLVTAGPGSGKTTVITHRILHLIANPGILPNEILVITFTKSAAEEMKERFLRLTKEKDTQVVFGTVHAFFIRYYVSRACMDMTVLSKKMKNIVYSGKF